MDSFSLIRVSLDSLLRNKTRTLLTTLGIIIGVASVILLVSIGNGLKNYVGGRFEALGANIIIALPVNITDESGRPQPMGSGPPVGGRTFSEREVRDIKRLTPAIKTAIPVAVKRLKARSPAKQRIIDITASTAKYQEVRDITLSRGSFYSDSDVEKSRKVVVLGPTAAKSYFPDGNEIGRKLTISSVSFTVIGVTNARGAGGAFGTDLDDQLYFPISTLQKLVDEEGIDTISIQAVNSRSIDPAIREIKAYLGRSRKPDSFSVIDQRQLLGTVQSILGVLTAGLSGIAAISLVVGGIGVMNMMLVSVTERTREIGLRKALGATPAIILTQFLIESVLITTFGGVIGIIIGGAGSMAINRFFPAQISLLSVLIAFGVSTAVGILFGILPARRAAKLSPITALRYE